MSETYRRKVEKQHELGVRAVDISFDSKFPVCLILLEMASRGGYGTTTCALPQNYPCSKCCLPQFFENQYRPVTSVPAALS